MTFRFVEARESQQSTFEPPTKTLIYHATGSVSGDFVRTYALTATPAVASHENGSLFRQDIRVDPVGYDTFTVTVPYAVNKVDNGSFDLDFDTTAGTIHVKQSLSTVNKYNAPGEPVAQDQGGLIGVDGDSVEGTDIVQPALKLTATFQHPAGVISMSQIKALAKYTGRVNSSSFLTFAAGEVLFLGAKGRMGTDTKTTVTYDFACSENLTNETIGLFQNVDKKGWDYWWITYRDAAVAGNPMKAPKWLYVEKVYRDVDLSSLLGFG